MNIHKSGENNISGVICKSTRNQRETSTFPADFLPRTGVLPLGSHCVPLDSNTCNAMVFRFVLIIPYGHTFATLALSNGMDVKTLSAMLGRMSAAITLDIYTHITDDMQRTAADNIDRGIGKITPQEGGPELGRESYPRPRRNAGYDRFSARSAQPAQGGHRMHQPDQRPSLRGALLAQVDRRQEARPQRLRPHPRGVRGKAEGAHRGDEGRAGGAEGAEGEGSRIAPSKIEVIRVKTCGIQDFPALVLVHQEKSLIG